MSARPLQANFYPHCSDEIIISKLKAISPCVDVVVLNTSLMAQTTGRGKDTKSKVKELTDLAAKFYGNIESQIDESKKIKVNDISIFDNIYGFTSMMTAEQDYVCYDIPIFNSPQIRVNNGAGYKYEQSIYSFVKLISQTGLGKIITDALGISKEVAGIIDQTERLAGLAGYSPRLGPYWSLADNPFSNRPSLQIDFKLINDSPLSASLNNRFLDQFIRCSLAALGSARESPDTYNNDWSWGSLWRPPKLFNVGLKWGATNGQPPEAYVKHYTMCTLEATVTPEGVMREGGIPDAYSVTMNFSSLIPDVLNAWQERQGFFNAMRKHQIS